ncbi:carboxylic ester hydrolase [Elysia marginata]|uniref:Carboxylic ester hydrolase n=1 Tax=Elysia marginata TaxID=1093978 RepID=A0AAV4EA32_9GAST|nr:carboxylic ester hydrolase [Elysia marginata]
MVEATSLRIPDKASLTVDPQGQRSIGRPKETWRRTVEDLKQRGLSVETAPLTATDRPRWRALQLPKATDGSERIE